MKIIPNKTLTSTKDFKKGAEQVNHLPGKEVDWKPDAEAKKLVAAGIAQMPPEEPDQPPEE